MTTKQALASAMNYAAAATNRTRSLAALAKEVPAAMFRRLVKQDPETMERDLQWATEGFQKAKAAYEAHCAEIGEPAYATWNED